MRLWPKRLPTGLLSILALVLVGVAVAPARGAIMVTGTSDTTALANALVPMGGPNNCLTLTNVSLSNLTKLNGAISSGTYALTPEAPGTWDYDLVGTGGIVLSTGNVNNYSSGPNTNMMMSTQYNSVATVAQGNLLKPVAGDGFGFLDATQLTITFDMGLTHSKICFDVVFGTEEWLKVFTFNNDAFVAYLNGTNIAIVDGHGLAANHPGATELVAPPQTTELNGVILSGGSPRLRIMAEVTPGSTNNVLTFLIADTADSQVDSTVYISNLMCCPEPSTWALAALGAGFLGVVGWRRRRAG